MGCGCITIDIVLTVGSIGIVLRAKESGGIPNAKPWLNKLKAAGMYISEDIIARCLIAVGEEP
jgi:predicted nucleic acid-binding protein